MSTLAPVKRREGPRSTMVMVALGYARSSQNAKTLPATPEPDMRILGFDILLVVMSWSSWRERINRARILGDSGSREEPNSKQAEIGSRVYCNKVGDFMFEDINQVGGRRTHI